VGFSGQKSALNADAQQWVDDHDGFTFTTAGNGDAYRDLIVSYPKLAQAMDYAAHHVDVRTGTNGIWDKIDAYEEAGNPLDVTLDVTLPADSPSSTQAAESWFTRAEAIDSYGSKVAHALYLEVHRVVPWSLLRWSTTQLALILDPVEIYQAVSAGSWDTEGSFPIAGMGRCVDHSPYRAYGLASSAIGSAPNPTEAFIKLMEYASAYVHSSGGDPTFSVPLVTSDSDKIARAGCHHISAIVRYLAQCINIPSEWALDALPGHSNFTFFTGPGAEEGYAIGHGDFVYGSASNSYENPTPKLRLLMPYSQWVTQFRDEADNTVALLNNYRESARTFFEWPSDYVESKFHYDGLILQFSQNGWAFHFLSYQSGLCASAPVWTVDEELQNFANLSLLYPDASPFAPEPSASDTGAYSASTPDTSPTLSGFGQQYTGRDVTGTITVTGTFVTITNCRIDAQGGVGIDLGDNTHARIWDCEIYNCSKGIDGIPREILRCHIHDCTDDAISLVGGYSFGFWPIVGSNLIDVGSANVNCIYIQDPAETFDIYYNSLQSTGAAPLIDVAGTGGGDGIYVHWNWMDGGNYALQFGALTGGGNVYKNRFGRVSSSGLINDNATQPVVWQENVYDDDDSTANKTDTAPL